MAFLGFGQHYFHIYLFKITLAVILPTAYATCYWPNGDTDGSYVQCPDTLSCCLEGESCLSNGLCFGARFGVLYRGACADKSWPIAECPRACYTGKQEYLPIIAAHVPESPK